MDRSEVRIANWNLEWEVPRSKSADIMRERLLATDPHIVCLTEADQRFLQGGYTIEAHPDHGYPIKPGRRKVLLWSKEPWINADQIGHPDLPSGRFIQGRTNTPIGTLTVIGVCIPWFGAHHTTGRRDRKRWEDHKTYLGALSEVLPRPAERTIVTGDFNQRVPYTTQPMEVFSALQSALHTYHLATSGKVEPLRVQLLDHIAHSRDLEAIAPETISNLHDGRQLTDHVGVALTLRERSID